MLDSISFKASSVFSFSKEGKIVFLKEFMLIGGSLR
jgi:hypothetical protein